MLKIPQLVGISAVACGSVHICPAIYGREAVSDQRTLDLKRTRLENVAQLEFISYTMKIRTKLPMMAQS